MKIKLKELIYISIVFYIVCFLIGFFFCPWNNIFELIIGTLLVCFSTLPIAFVSFVYWKYKIKSIKIPRKD